MPFNININIAAVLSAAFICFSLLALWFSRALFGSLLSSLAPERDQAPTLERYGIQFLFIIIFCLVMDVVVDSIGANGMTEGIYVGAAVWLLISLIHLAVSFRFDGRSILVKAIYSGYFLVASVISAALLSMWR